LKDQLLPKTLFLWIRIYTITNNLKKDKIMKFLIFLTQVLLDQ